MTLRCASVTLMLCGLLAAPAAAQVRPLPGQTWVLPGEGQTRTASAWPEATPAQMTEFTIYLDAYEDVPYDLDVEVAGDPATDPDGTLADANVIDRYAALPKPAFPEIFAARTRLDARWPATPGTYYWQASYEDGADVYAGPVRSLRIVPAPPPDAPSEPAAAAPYVAPTPATAGQLPLAASTARIVVRRAIAAATHRYPRGLHYRCATTPGAATCRPSWRDARFRYSGTLQISAAARGITAAFTGTRAERTCRSRCARAYAWTTAL